MKTVVITGSTRGIGLGLAGEFLKRGHAVAISARSSNKLIEIVNQFSKSFSQDRVAGQQCDVTHSLQVQQLWNTAFEKFGRVDIWINNAGISNTIKPLWEIDSVEINAVVNTNLTGLLYGCQIALRGMIQQGFGQIYNVEGFGSADMTRPGFTVYGATKRAIRYVTESLLEETKGLPIQIGTLGPGMVVTDFMINEMKKMTEEQLQEAKAVYNVLADTVETVVPFLVSGILSNNQTGTKIDWLTNEKAAARFEDEHYLNRDLFSKYGL